MNEHACSLAVKSLMKTVLPGDISWQACAARIMFDYQKYRFGQPMCLTQRYFSVLEQADERLPDTPS